MKLYTPKHVVLAAFLGTPIAGGLLLASSLRALGRKGEAWRALGLSTLLAVAWITLAALLPVDRHFSFVGELLAAAIMTPWATRLLELDERAHLAAGGKLKSTWAAAGVGLATMLALVLLLLGLAFAGPVALRQRLTGCAIEGPDQVCFDDGATLADARAVLDALLAEEIRPGEALDVKVSRQGDALLVWLTLQDGAWDKDEIVAGFTELGQHLKSRLGGRPLALRLADIHGQSRREIPLGAN